MEITHRLTQICANADDVVLIPTIMTTLVDMFQHIERWGFQMDLKINEQILST